MSSHQSSKAVRSGKRARDALGGGGAAARKRQRRAEAEAAESELSSTLFAHEHQHAFARPSHDTPPDDDDFMARVLGTSLEESAAAAHSPQEAGDDSVWVDEDDKDVKIDIKEHSRLKKLQKKKAEKTAISGVQLETKLRAQFQSLNPPADWAKPADAEESQNSLLTSSNSLVSSDDSAFSSARLDVTRLADANVAERSDSVVRSIGFHPNAQMLYTAGLDKTLRLYEVDGKVNAKMQSVFLPDLPISSAHIAPDGSEICMTGRRPFFYYYDLGSGTLARVNSVIGRSERSLEHMEMSADGKYMVVLAKDGNSVFISRKTKQRIFDLKLNGSVRSASFSPDGNYYVAAGGQGTMYCWDLRTRKCLKTVRDEGSLETCSLAASSSHLAAGSSSGVVNVYRDFFSSDDAIVPQKSFMHLTTKIDGTTFNHDGNMLAMFSSRKKDSLKLVHTGTMQVMSRWPTSNTPLSYVSAVAFSPHSGVLAVANDKGVVLSYRLNHYRAV